MEEPYKVAFDVGTQPTQDSWTSLIWSLLIVSVVFQGMRRPMADRLAMLGLDVGVARSAVLGIFILIFALGEIVHYRSANLVPSLKAKERAGQVSIFEGCLQYFHPGLQEK